MEKLHFKTSSGIKSIVGRDLITDKFVAIFELVKNSYDAGAKKVVVSFNNLHSSNSVPITNTTASSLFIDTNLPHIVIADNGHGMDKNALINKWLYLAYSEKQEGHQNNERVFVGSKGVGRFSCDTLGEILNIRTKKAHEKIEHRLMIDWANFDQDLQKEFGKIDVTYDTKIADSDEQYTILTIGKLRHSTWQNDDEQKRAKQNLTRLKNPFVEDNSFNIYLGENLSIEQPNIKNRIVNNIAEILKDRTTTIEATIDKNIKIYLYDRGELIYSASKLNDTILIGTPIKIFLNYLNSSAKNMFTRRMGIQTVNYGNIFIYKNDFRVMPYGETEYDLFGLNLRKTQGYSRYLGTREVIGFISIHDMYHSFKETTSRNNGFIENAYFKALEEIYLSDIHMLLERYVNLIKWGENAETKEEVYFDNHIGRNEVNKFKQYITKTKKFDINYFKDNLDIEKNNPEKQLDSVIEKITDKKIKQKVKQVKYKFSQLKQENQEKDNIIKEKNKKIHLIEKQTNTLLNRRNDSHSYAEQVAHHFTKMASTLQSSIKKLSLIQNMIPEERKSDFIKSINQIRKTEMELTFFRELLLKTQFDMRSAQQINLYRVAEWFFSEKKEEDKFNIICNVSEPMVIDNWNIQCKVLDFVMMLENFYNNAKEHNANFIEFIFYSNQITITNDSVAIDESLKQKIFELGFSTKENGTGIGLYQIKQFCKKNNFFIEVENVNNHVVFTISKEKE